MRTTSNMISLKNVSVIFILLNTTTATDICPASGSVETVLRESPLFQNVKPKIPGTLEMTTSTRSECALQCHRISDCRSMFYSITDNVCLLYGGEVNFLTFKKYPGMQRFDVENDVPADCYDVVKKGIQADGLYMVKPRDNGQPISVYCEISNGGWLIFQRRTDGLEDFYRTWNDYKDGFGNLNNAFWLGNTNIHRLTTQGVYELRVDLEDLDGNVTYASYKNFSIAGEDKNFQLSVDGYSGTAGDSLQIHSGCKFSAKDKDVAGESINCAEKFKGGWWYRYWTYCNLNGVYDTNKVDETLVWWHPCKFSTPLSRRHLKKRTVMKIRPSKIVL